jgi:predicted NBD/HSP70 family sugar kinase/DNA-binding CsgD family transcriptional regulator
MASQTRNAVAAIPPLLKDLNERTVLETIRADAPISRAQISRRAGISKPTVSVALRSLLQASLVREVDHDPGGRGYGAVFFEPVAEAALVLGLDVGARFLRGALCDLRGDIRARQDVELDGADVGEVSRAIVDLKASLLEASGLEGRALECAVLGVPGAVDDDSRVHLAPRVRGLEGRQLGRELAERLSVPVTLENDINLAALGERWHGVARGVDDFAFLSIGTGLGAGLVLGGELHRGRHGAAGEVDLVHGGEGEDVDPSADAIATLAARLARDTGLQTGLASPYRSPDVFAAARRGDPLGRAVVEEEARRIALHIVPIAAVVDVALVVLGGGVGVNGDLLLAPVRTALERWLPYPPQVEVSTLGEAAVLSGALSVGLSAALDNVFVNRSRDVEIAAAGSGTVGVSSHR